MVKRTQRIFTLCTAAFLLFVFTMPGVYLRRVADSMSAAILEAEAETASGGDPARALVRLSSLYTRHSDTLKMFLDHVSVDAVGAAIAACTPLSEPDTLLASLSTTRAALSHLLGIESLTPESLL